MKEMTFDDCKKLEKVTKKVDELLKCLCLPYNHGKIDYLHLCAMIVISGRLNSKFPGSHNNVASISNILCIDYGAASYMCFWLTASGHLEPTSTDADIKLSPIGLEYVERYVKDNLFILFRNRMFEAINEELYPGESQSEGIEPENSMLNIKIGKDNCSKQLYEKILELPCVWMCYFGIMEPYTADPKKDAKNQLSFDICMNRLEKKNTSEYIADIIGNILNKVVNLPEDLRREYINEDDLLHLHYRDFNFSTYVNGKIIRIWRGDDDDKFRGNINDRTKTIP